MKKLNLIPGILLLLAGTFTACETEGDPVKGDPVKEVATILMNGPWYFFSSDGLEGYDCNKQTNMRFHANGTLEINGYIREPDYTCSGPHLLEYKYVLRDNDTKIEWEGELFTIVKLTETEFIKSANRNGKNHVWVYRRYL